MGRFKTPFSASQKSSDGGDVVPKDNEGVAWKDKGLSPLRIGRTDVITPRTKSKIKRRFATQLAEQIHMKLTSPGVPVPFDLSQSQPVISQGQWMSSQEGSVLSEELNEDINDIGSTNIETTTVTTLNSGVIVEDHKEMDRIIQEDKIIAFEDKDHEDHTHGYDLHGLHLQTLQCLEDESKDDIVAADSGDTHVQQCDTKVNFEVIFESDTEDEHVDTSNATLQKRKGEGSKQMNAETRSKHEPCRKKRNFVFHTLPKLSKRNKGLQTKKRVLSIIDKMHREIGVLQKRRAKLMKGGISKIAASGIPYEE